MRFIFNNQDKPYMLLYILMVLKDSGFKCGSSSYSIYHNQDHVNKKLAAKEFLAIDIDLSDKTYDWIDNPIWPGLKQYTNITSFDTAVELIKDIIMINGTEVKFLSDEIHVGEFVVTKETIKKIYDILFKVE